MICPVYQPYESPLANLLPVSVPFTISSPASDAPSLPLVRHDRVASPSASTSLTLSVCAIRGESSQRAPYSPSTAGSVLSLKICLRRCQRATTKCVHIPLVDADGISSMELDLEAPCVPHVSGSERAPSPMLATSTPRPTPSLASHSAMRTELCAHAVKPCTTPFIAFFPCRSVLCWQVGGPATMADGNKFELFEKKMRAEGLSEAAIDAFRYNYQQLVEGVTGMVCGPHRPAEAARGRTGWICRTAFK